MKIKCAPLGSLGANFYMITDDETKQMFVVDPGACPQTALELIEECNCELRYIILTHAHGDHIGAVDDIKEKFGAPVVICREDAPALNDGKLNLCPVLGVPSPKTKADIEVTDMHKLPFGNGEIVFLHTPGHTKGSMCICADDFLISGDTIFNLSVGRSDFPGGDFDELRSSILEKIYTLAPSTTIYPGHGSPTTVEYEKANNPFVRG